MYALAFEHVADKSVRGEEVVNLLIDACQPSCGGRHSFHALPRTHRAKKT